MTSNSWFRLAFSALSLILCSCTENDSKVVPASVNLNPCVNNVLSGYTDKVSYFPGDEVQVFLQSNSTLVCGLGFYNIRGQLMFKSNISLFPQNVSVDEPWKKGFNFASNGRVILPSTLASGVYLIENKIPIVVKSAAASDVTVVYPCNTINAYSNSGGKSLYGFNSTDNVASHTVSFLRPMNSNGEENECIKCLKWFPNLRNITINYITDLDLDDYSSIALSKVLVVTGHSEYWTRGARINFDRHVNEGKHAVVLSGNTMWWQVRYAETRDALICYKSILLDPITEPALKTTLWADPSLQFSILASIGQDFNHGGYSLQTGNGWNGFKIFNPASPLLQGTSLNKGDILSVPSRECDGAPIAGWDTDGFPVLDNSLFHFAKLELIGFDRGMRGGIETFPTFIVMQKFNTSGIIVNVGSIGWCSALGIGSSPSGNRVEMITQNAIMKLLNGDNVFSN